MNTRKSKTKIEPEQTKDETKLFEQWEVEILPFNFKDNGGAKFKKVKCIALNVNTTPFKAMQLNSSDEKQSGSKFNLLLLLGEKREFTMAEIQY